MGYRGEVPRQICTIAAVANEALCQEMEWNAHKFIPLSHFGQNQHRLVLVYQTTGWLRKVDLWVETSGTICHWGRIIPQTNASVVRWIV